MWKQITTKNWKKIKEIGEKEDKRPPWRVVSVSTLPKADKNALLRAKLLDASRRLRAGKNQVGIQTDMIPTKLMKEVQTQIYDDLIPHDEKGILTDGTIKIRQDGTGDFLLTHSVSQMTDDIQAIEVQTQTATPRISHRFFDEYYNQDTIAETLNDLDKCLTDNEKMLIEQVRALREVDRQLQESKLQKESDMTENDLSDDSLLVARTSSKQNTKSMRTNRRASESTNSSWYFDFDEGDDDTDLPVLPRRMYTEGYQPWNSFRDMVIGRKLANMKLSPIPVRKASLKKKTVSWNDAQHNAVLELLNEANALLDVFDEMSILLGPDLQLNELQEKESSEVRLLSDYWNPILKENSEILEKKLKDLKNPKLKKFEPVKAEIFDL